MQSDRCPSKKKKYGDRDIRDIYSHRKRHPRSLQEGGYLQVMKEPPEDHRPNDINLGFQVLKKVKKNYLLFKPPSV